MRKQAGFTLIELVMVIVILGILAATALPKFVDLSGEADQAAVRSVASTISSATSINYATKKINSASGVDVSSAADACAAAASSVVSGQTSLLQSGITLVTGTPANSTEYKVAALSGACSAGATATCTITSKGGKTATANATCTN